MENSPGQCSFRLNAQNNDYLGTNLTGHYRDFFNLLFIYQKTTSGKASLLNAPKPSKKYPLPSKPIHVVNPFVEGASCSSTLFLGNFSRGKSCTVHITNANAGAIMVDYVDKTGK